MEGIEILKFAVEHGGLIWAAVVLVVSSGMVGWYAKDVWRRVGANERWIIEHSKQTEQGFARIDKLESIAERLTILVDRHDGEIELLRKSKHDFSNMLMVHEADIRNLKERKSR